MEKIVKDDNQLLSTRIHPKLHKAFTSNATHLGVTKSDLLRTAVKDKLLELEEAESIEEVIQSY